MSGLLTKTLRLVALLIAGHVSAANYYDPGAPTLADLWVDPVTGNDANSGSNRATPLRTLSAAWSRIPSEGPLATGVRINLVPGTYPCEPGPEASNCVNYFSHRRGTYQAPIVIRAIDGPNTVTLRGGMDVNAVSYLYVVDVGMAGGGQLPVNASGNNLLHLSDSDHVLLKGVTLTGPACTADTCNNLQEVFKVNQVQYLYVEDSTIGGAWHSSVDYMVVQYGHLLNNRLHTAGQWCMYLKGGSAYLRIEGNELTGCQLGFQAGQSANLARMRSPWLHYDAYDIKFVNNVLHHIPGVGMSVAGSYDILFAFNTLYRVGTSADPGYPLVQLVHGERNCTPTDEQPNPVPACEAHTNAGAWGPNILSDSLPAIPNRNVRIVNNVLYNPAPHQSRYSHFLVAGPLVPPTGFRNLPSPARSDDLVEIRGNVVWNGPSTLPLGFEDADQGCQPVNAACNAAQVRTDNAINNVEPKLIDPENGNFHLQPGSTPTTVAVADFVWSDLPPSPAVPVGTLSNAVTVDRDGLSRAGTASPGAHSRALANCPPATLSASMRLQLPAVAFNGTTYTADLDLLPATDGGLRFRLVGASGASECSGPAILNHYFGAFRLRLPRVTYGDRTYAADLSYDPAQSSDMVFVLTAATEAR